MHNSGGAPAPALASHLARRPRFAAHLAAQGSQQQEALRLLALVAFSLPGLLQALARRAWTPALWMSAAQVHWRASAPQSREAVWFDASI